MEADGQGKSARFSHGHPAARGDAYRTSTSGRYTCPAHQLDQSRQDHPAGRRARRLADLVPELLLILALTGTLLWVLLVTDPARFMIRDTDRLPLPT